jgi:copper(I)-binding protein
MSLRQWRCAQNENGGAMGVKVSIKASLIGVVIATFLSPACAAEKTSGPWKLRDISVEQAWARVTPGGARTGAVYLTIHNKSAEEDLLLAVDSAAAQTTALHESKIEDGTAKMVSVPGGLYLPSHGEVVMRPGGIHIMMTGLSGALEPGSTLPVRMIFRDAGALDFEVPVLPLGAADPAAEHKGHGS